jgi:hypothetical protein
VSAAQGPYRLKLAPQALAQRDELRRTDERKYKKLDKALRHLKENPAHPGLHAHKWDTLKGKAPDGGDIWTAYVENRTPSAWRIFYYFDRSDPDSPTICVASIRPHGKD